MRIGLDAALAEKIEANAARAAADAGVAWPEAWRRPIVDATLREWKRRASIRADDTKKLERGMPGRVATIESFMMAMNS